MAQDLLDIKVLNVIYTAPNTLLEVILRNRQSFHSGEVSLFFDVYDMKEGGIEYYDLQCSYPSAPYLLVAGRKITVTYSSLTTTNVTIDMVEELKYECVQGSCVSRSTSQQTLQQCQQTCSATGDFLKMTVDKSNVAVGETAIFTITSNKPDGTIINLYQQLPLGQDFLIESGVLQGGVCVLTHTFTANGSTVQYACIPGYLSSCELESNLVPVIVEGTDLTTTALYAVGLLAVAYVAGQYLSNRRS